MFGPDLDEIFFLTIEITFLIIGIAMIFGPVLDDFYTDRCKKYSGIRQLLITFRNSHYVLRKWNYKWNLNDF